MRPFKKGFLFESSFFFAGTEFTTDLLSALSCLELIGRCHSVPEVVVVFRSMSLSEQLNTYPSPNPTQILTCHQLTIVGSGEG